MRCVGAIAVLAAILAQPAAAETSAQVRDLAIRAERDPVALAQLERIRVVAGRRVDLRAALEGASGDELRSRLQELARTRTAQQSPGGARANAASILREHRFHGSAVPRPLHGVLAWLGRLLHRIFGPVGRLGRHVPGGVRVAWTILAVVLVVLTALVAARVGRRRSGRRLELGDDRRSGRRLDPAKLDRDAEEAERRGELELALRLRFRAGLLRLGGAEAIPLRASLTSGEAGRLLRSPIFDELSRDFDEVVYGGLPAGERHVLAAREQWPRLLDEVRR